MKIWLFFGFSLICLHSWLLEKWHAPERHNFPKMLSIYPQILQGETGRWAREPKTGHPNSTAGRRYTQCGSSPVGHGPLGMATDEPPWATRPRQTPRISSVLHRNHCCCSLLYLYFLPVFSVLSLSDPERHHPKWEVFLVPCCLPGTMGVLLQHFGKPHSLFQMEIKPI